ncbi:bifunctional UDP-2,4-diacetamido-2,4,6-trideoxy-beta-L-altropyranose hydrolase/GNAT family N-acetyltransferase [Gracilibacillus caseinilyticus]|uniref:Bifunctional UDP-2,4-diacetamido-2,4,6-trideoxy-beta-L-altropyranose hydrolase/GNAT family N-acetyltransferase n=1 Tax=Gracilibacillus caseinilyticus TaxID=2932256 RepID=A0ABY4EWS3_9BACI|nr:bifunctional UDP-2,4-diacetamido-2,4,6-trideoxy-beta-L-altropyranose hydrolase/GNAT family N-acetyltransferase [Gracilibacillus caseinilyticus]UOQ48297.1 bifunctional UDP-2,4-diacetamido-2,4,6-trideoxy-beta-L-altropyranose hydrolase/GNAT family N-acetyltransferase [Gracilibacillus caseinilyticus]
MRVLIFTEAGSKIGLGHIIRCLSLYREITARNIDVQLIIEGDIDYNEILKDVQFNVINWYSHEHLNNIIQPNDYCIIDSYIASRETYIVISKLAKKCLYIDDYYRINYPEGMVITPSLISKEFKDKGYTHYISGPNVICLRESFLNNEPKEIRRNVSNILITLGGSNLSSLLSNIVDLLCNRYSAITFHVVGNLKSHLINKPYTNLKIYNNLTADRMKNLMITADFAITGAGQTVFELIATGTPFIPVQIAENQKNSVKNLIDLKLCNQYLNHDEENLLDKLLISFEENLKYDVRKISHEKLINIIDLNSVRNIVNYLLLNDEMISQYKIRKAVDLDIFNVYNLSNDPIVRYFSLNQQEISWKEHVHWYEKVLTKTNLLFYIIENNKSEFFGQIRFEIDKDFATISISLTDNCRGKGLSLSFVFESIKKMRKECPTVTKIVAYIKKDNEASKKVFERAGFNFVNKEQSVLKYILNL